MADKKKFDEITYPFLRGPGEMATLIRNFDWVKTGLGAPDTWSITLRTTVGILLSSRFPMFLWWGDKFIQFYNDAYRPSLGSTGKHPLALGQNGKDCWHEIWDIIYPLIEQVRTTGQATWHENQLVPFYRNGKTEDIYWTFSYSPVYNENDKVEGVLVVCTETTQSVENIKRLEDVNQHFNDLVMQSPIAIAVFRGEQFVCEIANNAYLPLVGKTREEFIGKPLFESLPALKTMLEPLAKELVRTGQALPEREFEILVERNGSKKLCYFTSVWEPLRENDGQINGFIAVAHETTEHVIARKELEESEERFRTMAEGTDILIVVGNETSNSVYFNKAWVDLTGRAMAELLEFGWADLVHPEDRERYVNIYVTALAEKKPFTGEFRILNKDGGYTWLLAKSPARFRADGSFAGYISSCIDITERKHAEEEKQKLAAIIEASTEFIGLAALDTSIQYINPAGLKMLGWESFEGRHIIDCIYPDDRVHINTMLPERIAKGSSKHEIRFWNEKTGHILWLQWNGITIKDPVTGEIIGLATNSANITDRKIAEEALKQSEQEVRSLVESAPFPIGVYAGMELRVVLANQAMLDVWGKGKDVIDKLYPDILPELGDQKIFDQLEQVMITGIPFHARNQRVDLMIDGKLHLFYFNYSLTPLYDTAGEVYGIMNTAADVTDLNIAKQQVEENEKSFRNTILKAPVAMCIFRGPNFMVEIANDRMIELWGKNAADVLSKPIFEGLPEIRNQGFEQLLHHVFTTGETFSAQDVPINLPRNGVVETVYVNFMYEPYRETDQVISGVIAVAVEVTDQLLARHKIEEIVTERTAELAEANSNLHTSNAELAQYAYIASHDLQEPLRKIGTFSQMLENSLGDIDARSKSYLDKITNAASRMTLLVRDVLAYSQLSKINEIFLPVDLSQIMKDVTSDFELLIDQKNAVINYADLPTIDAIPLQMSQLFSNLLSNALKFVKPGTAPLITIKATLLSPAAIVNMAFVEPGKKYIHIEFSDNGIGFEKGYEERIFNIFQRLHGRAVYEGTGIGLAICKKIAQNHHGHIYASGSENGAVFNVVLPIQQMN